MTRTSAPAYVLLAIFAAIVLYPLIGILLLAIGGTETGASVTLSKGFTFEHFQRAWSRGSFDSALVNSAVVATSVMVIGAVLSVMAGFAFGVLNFPGRTLLFYTFMLGIIFPLEAYVIPLYYQLQDYSLLDSYLGLILPEAGFAVVFGTFWMRASFRSMPRSLLEAARIDGARLWTILWRVFVPPAMPAILTMMVLTFMWTWNSFLIPLIVVSSQDLRTAPLGMAFFIGQRTTDYPGLAAGALIISLPVVAVFLMLQRHFFRGMLSGAAR